MHGGRRSWHDRAVLFAELAATSSAVAATSKRSEKVSLLADVLARLEPDDVVAAVAFLTGQTPIGRIGVGWATMSSARPAPSPAAELTIADVDRALREIDGIAGDGSVDARRVRLDALFGAATADEQRLLVGIVGGELRQGANEGVLASAVAAAAGVTVAAVRRGAMFAGDLGVAARAALDGGPGELAAITIEPGRPVQPMLASSSPTVTAALESIGAADGAAGAVEWKLDGARIQAHRAGGEVRLFTRNLNDVTARLPGVVATVASYPAGDLVLDGEVMGVAADDAPRAFQDTIGDFAAEAGGADGDVRGSSLRAWFFDALVVDGRPVVDEPLRVRRSLLADVVPESDRAPSVVTSDVDAAEAFFDATVAAGHEGVVVKDLDAAYEAGRRGAGWRKVKPVHTLDLVVLAVEWGSGRRRGLLSNIHLGARNDGSVDGAGDFVMVGKTFKGMTDEMLRWQTERFTQLRTDEGTPEPWERHRSVVRVRPIQVVEIAVDGVQRSTTYPGAVTLRFARVRGYRLDKGAGEADTISAVRALL